MQSSGVCNVLPETCRLLERESEGWTSSTIFERLIWSVCLLAFFFKINISYGMDFFKVYLFEAT